MAVKQDTLTDIRDYSLGLFEDNVTTIAYGSDDTTPSSGDDGVITSIGTTSVSSIDTGTTGTRRFKGSIGISTSNGNTVREIALKSSTKNYTRDLVVPRAKTSDEIFRFTTIVGSTVINN